MARYDGRMDNGGNGAGTGYDGYGSSRGHSSGYGGGNPVPRSDGATSQRGGTSSRPYGAGSQRNGYAPRPADGSHTGGPYVAGPYASATSPYASAPSPYASAPAANGGKGPRKPQMDRRTFLVAAGGAAIAAIVGIAGVGWWTHRAVACTVNGVSREAPIGSSAADIVKRGYAYPSAGNLVSICNEGEAPEVLTKGGGNPYTLTVNGVPVDVEKYRLGAGDALEFADGTDVTEQVIAQNTPIACGVQYPADRWYLNSVGFVRQWGRDGVHTVETGSVSGKVIDRGVTQEPQDLIIDRSGINPADGRWLVALTFDDGPDPVYTPQYLDILARYGARATFFNIGYAFEEGDVYTQLSQRCVAEGHQVASHTYSHSFQTLTGMSAQERNADISRGFEVVSANSGVPTHVLRPPFGELHGVDFYEYLLAGGNIAYSAYWSVDSGDWELPGADAIVYNCTRNLSGDNYNGAVILMHDGGGDRSQDVAALPRIIETFQAAGYQLVTMNEMLAADPTFPSWVSAGYVERPEGAIVPDASAPVTYLEYDA